MKRTELVTHFLRDKNARRRGLGIEIALLVLLAVFAMSALLVSAAVLERDGMNRREAETLERLALDQIGEDFLAGKIAVGDHGDFTIAYTQGKSFNVHMSGELKLDVKIGDDDKVTGWSYHNLGTGG